MQVDKYTSRTQIVLGGAESIAQQFSHSKINGQHLLLAFIQLEESHFPALLSRLGIDLANLKATLQESLSRIPPESSPAPDLSEPLRQTLREAEKEAAHLQDETVDPEHLFLGLLSTQDPNLQTIFKRHHLEREPILQALLELRKHLQRQSLPPPAVPNGDSFPASVGALSGSDHTDPVIGREAEILEALEVLARRSKPNPILVGERGVGKKAVITELARRLQKGQVPEPLRHKRLLFFPWPLFTTGMPSSEDLTARFHSILQEIDHGQADAILCIEDLPALLTRGSLASQTVHLLKTALAERKLRCIATATFDSFARCTQTDPLLERFFQQVCINEPSPETALEMLRALKDRYQAHHKIFIHDSALECAIRLSLHCQSGRALPGRAVDLLDEAAARLRLQLERFFNERREEERLLPPELRAEEVADLVSLRAGIPADRLRENEPGKLVVMEEILSRRVLGQEDAIAALSAALRRARAGLQEVDRPLGSFLFLGPAGVGKTALARALAELLVYNERAMTRLSMSDYMDPHSVARLFGSPRGTADWQEGGHLTEEVRRRPSSVVLLDEIEKADPAVIKALLKVLDEGRWIDAFGRPVSFSQTVLIMTTCLGSPVIQEYSQESGLTAKDHAEMEERVKMELKGGFCPEFLEHLDDIIIFHPLNERLVERILDLELEKVKQKLQSRRLTLEINGGARQFLSREGFDREMGARPLKRAIQEHLLNPLSLRILLGEFQPGDTIQISGSTKDLIFRNKTIFEGRQRQAA